MTEKDIIKLAMEYGFTGGFDAQGNLTFDATFVEAVTEAVAKTRKATLEEMIYAQPEQEPVGFAVMQKPWVGLTDEEIEHIIVSVPFADEEDYEVVIRAAVAKLKEKNTRNGGCL